mgnify:CR=1 FL=1
MKKNYFKATELVTLGIFAASSKVITILIALLGGGPNPITIIIKNLIMTTLLVVLMYKVRKCFALSLFVLIQSIVSFFLLQGGFTSIPILLLAALLSESLVMLLGGFNKFFAPILAIAIYDILQRTGSLFLSYLFMREMPELLFFVGTIIVTGYIGAIIGLYTGYKKALELKHASIIHE